MKHFICSLILLFSPVASLATTLHDCATPANYCSTDSNDLASFNEEVLLANGQLLRFVATCSYPKGTVDYQPFLIGPSCKTTPVKVSTQEKTRNYLGCDGLNAEGMPIICGKEHGDLKYKLVGDTLVEYPH